jgi:hypothetical protein
VETAINEFINPYDLSETIGFKNLEFNTIRNFKKRLFAELDLLDGEISIKGKIAFKSECLDLLNIIELSDSYLTYYKIIYENDDLNTLLYGKSNKYYLRTLSNQLRLESEGFNGFIGTYLSASLKKIYKNAFLNNEVEITRLELHLNKAYLEYMYMPVYKVIQDRIDNLIKLEKSQNFNFDEVKSIFGSTSVINTLPNYFSKIKNDLFQKVRNISITACNDLNDIDLAMEIIDFTLLLTLQQKTREKFEKDKNDLVEIKESRKYSAIADDIFRLGEQLNNKSISSYNLLKKVKSLTNNLHKNDSIALGLRSVSLSFWNDNEDIENAISCSKMALKFVIGSGLKTKLRDDNKILNETLKKCTCWYCKSNIAIDEKYHESISIWKYEKTGVLASLIGNRKYYKKEIPVPRCPTCYSTHSDYGFFSFGLKSDLNKKTISYKSTIPSLNDWDVGVGP